jgi:hypothetical protein
LLKVLSDVLRLLVSLKPSLILLMKTPTLILESLGCHVLLGGALLVVKDVEKRVGVDAGVQPWVIKDGKRLSRET